MRLIAKVPKNLKRCREPSDFTRPMFLLLQHFKNDVQQRHSTKAFN